VKLDVPNRIAQHMAKQEKWQGFCKWDSENTACVYQIKNFGKQVLIALSSANLIQFLQIYHYRLYLAQEDARTLQALYF